VIYIQKDIVRGNPYMENQQTYSRDDIYTKCNDIQARPPHAIILTYFPYSNLKQTKIIN
jgi:hypothetical protein